MYFSLSKKILYSLLSFLFLTALLFLTIFINLYSQKISDNKNQTYMRNEYVVKLLNDNIRLQTKLAEIGQQYPDALKDYNIYTISRELGSKQRELTNEQRLNDELRKNYNSNTEAIKTGAEVIGYSLFIIILLILLLLFLLDFWVIRPAQRISDVSTQVSSGVYTSRLPVNSKKLFKDEFDILYTAFNQMLDNIENNIAETSRREKFLQHLLDGIPEGIRVIDQNYNVIMTNLAFNQSVDIDKNKTSGKCYAAYGYNECDGCPEGKYNCPIKFMKKNKEDVLHTIHEIGKTPFYLNAARMPLNANNFYIVEVLHDLSNDVRYSHQQKVSSLAFLSTSIAHEMKNNLGAIRLILEGMLEDNPDSATDYKSQRKYLSLIHKQLVEAVKTPERLLQLARFSEDETGEISIADAVQDMLHMIDYDAKRHGIFADMQVDKNIKILANDADFKMIVLNLLQNAVKAMPNGGSLRVTGNENNKKVIISVKDTGIGIESKKLKHIFEPFYSATGKIKSSGLGLAIVKSLVSKMKGEIKVISKVGVGTEFIMKFPRVKKKKS